MSPMHAITTEFGAAAIPLANVFTYFAQSNMAGKVIVVLLIIFSLIAWTLMLSKYHDLNHLRNINRRFARALSKSPSVHGMEELRSRRARGPYVELTRDAVDALGRARHASSEAARFGWVENALQRGVAETTNRYETKMVMLGSIVTGAPFMGLLGTVWGVMDAFGAIGLQAGGASLQLLAPGVSGALLTTVAGLLVAIPSVFGYNYLLAQTKIMTTELENFASALADRLELESREPGG